MRRRHGGRRARVRGLVKVAADFALLAAAVNLARLGVLGVAYRNGTWAASGGNRERLASSRPHRPRQGPSAASPGPHQTQAEGPRQRSAAVLATLTGTQRESRSHKTVD